MSKFRNFVLLTNPQPQFLFTLLLLFFIKSNINGQLFRSQKSSRSPKSTSEYYRVNFVLPDELPADHFIGNIPTQLPNFPLSSGVDLTVSTTVLDSTGLAPRLLRASDTGDLFTQAAIDRDDPDQICGPLNCCKLIVCNLTVSVLFIHPHWKTIIVHVNLQFHDSNDNTPTFPQPIFSLWIPEDNGLQLVSASTQLDVPRQRYDLPSACDADSDPNGLVTYKLTGNYLAKTTFQLNSNISSGHLSINVRSGVFLDYDQWTERIFKLTLEAIDGGQPALTGHMLLIIHLTDLNDSPPVFDKQTDSIHIAENTMYKAPIYVVHASDADSEDNALVRYSMEAALAALPNSLAKHFSFHPVTGELYLHQMLDYEQYEQRHIDLQFVAYDAGNPPLSSTMKLTIYVRDMNDNAPQLVVQLNQTILENSVPNQLALRLSVRDLDEVSMHSVHCDPNPYQTVPLRFEKSIDNITFSLYTTDSVDYEQYPRLHYEIACVDSAEHKQIRRFNLTVAIKDVNDNIPVFRFPIPNPSKQYNVTISESEPVNKLILIVTADDADSNEYGRVTYRLTDLNSIQQSVVTHHSTTQNCSHPCFRDYFNIDKETGSLFLTRILDYELVNTFVFAVLAVDNPYGEETKKNSATATIHVQVLDVNDNAPILSSPKTLTVVEHVPVGTTVGSVWFTDMDTGQGGKVEIRGLLPTSLQDGQSELNDGLLINSREMSDIHQYFKLTETGLIVTTRAIDREKTSTFRLRILAVDNDDRMQMKTTATVTINVIDINDNAPVILHPSPNSTLSYIPVKVDVSHKIAVLLKNTSKLPHQSVVYSDQLVKSLSYKPEETQAIISGYVTSPIVQQVKAYDVDEGQNAELTFKMIEECNGSDLFHIDSNTGTIRFQPSLLVEHWNLPAQTKILWNPPSGVYRMCVQAVDQGEPSLSSSVHFWLKVVEPISKSIAKGAWPADSSEFSQVLFKGNAVNGTNFNDTHSLEGLYSASKYIIQDHWDMSDVNLSNVVISLLVAIFAITFVCALTAAILWAHSKHRKRQLPTRYETRNIGRAVYVEGAKWTMHMKQLEPLKVATSEGEIGALVCHEENTKSETVGEVVGESVCKERNVGFVETAVGDWGGPFALLVSGNNQLVNSIDSLERREEATSNHNKRKHSCGLATLTTTFCDLIPHTENLSNWETRVHKQTETHCPLDSNAIRMMHKITRSPSGSSTINKTSGWMKTIDSKCDQVCTNSVLEASLTHMSYPVSLSS
ncbi:protocadherin delta 1 [Paragonimus westermani]|uniref:Protocadherin delta 1 n=1 Tax=Paragonimus westermani TaxID=34504 RepID=A0A5J4NGJ2_9TREM|nr:protocadherin delta 1 [Paragonimus westermani]